MCEFCDALKEELRRKIMRWGNENIVGGFTSAEVDVQVSRAMRNLADTVVYPPDKEEE